MTHAHHHPGHSHPPVSATVSLLRMSASGRLAVAAIVIVLIWAAALWAMWS
jgi:hypothetical protein